MHNWGARHLRVGERYLRREDDNPKDFYFYQYVTTVSTLTILPLLSVHI
jgi:hypothetical protein